MTKGEIESAERRALNIFDEWNDCTGVAERNTGYYYELQGVVKDAVHCGIQEALRDFKPLGTSEYERIRFLHAPS